MEQGDWFRCDLVRAAAPELNVEWQEWLTKNFDPGNWDAYKVRDQDVLPYIDGRPQWVTDAYMPAHLVERLRGIVPDLDALR